MNELKERLYGLIRKLWEAVNAIEMTPIRDELVALFAPRTIASTVAADRRPSESIEAFELAHREQLNDLHDAVKAHLERELAGQGAAVGEALQSGTSGWPGAARAAVLDADAAFAAWDVLLYPLRQVSETAELDRVDVMRLSPFEIKRLYAVQDGEEVRGPLKLAGVKAAHFGAFFSRDRRENDYLWGRLDAAEWILRLLLDADPPPADLCADAFGAVLDSEAKLTEIGDLRARLVEQISKLRIASGTPS